MTTERPIDDQITEDWLLNEQRKIQNFCDENVREFTETCLLEVDWLKNYLTSIIIRSSELPHDKPPDCTSPNRRCNDKKFERKETFNNPIGTEQNTEPRNLTSFRSSNAASRDCVKVMSSVNDPSNKKTFPKRPAQSKPEIKSLVLAAAAAKKEEQEKKYERIKEWEAKRLAASQRRHEEEQKRLQNAKQREEEWKRKANVIPETKKKENDGSKNKRTDKPKQKKKKDVDMQQKNDIAPSEKILSQSELKDVMQKSPLRSSNLIFDQRNDLPELDWNPGTNDEDLHRLNYQVCCL